MMQPTHGSNRILRPVRDWFIWLTLLLAMFFNMIPFGRFPGIPDAVALVLTFWCIREPFKIGMAAAFLIGIVMDVSSASVMGQHSLAYVLLAFTASGLSRRFLQFPLLQQALQILPLLLAAQLVMLAARMSVGAEFPGMEYFLESFSAALLWYPLTYLLLLPQYQPIEKDENRPI
ncbi:MAG: rod shape-determining protein MreD [Sterolibacterium sp.]|nr:rod shape-determining protein MreD [Sterolibacterium sp.]